MKTLLLALLPLTFACGSVSEPTTNPGSNIPSSPAITTDGAVGYVHSFSCSKFHVGTNVGIASDMGLDKHIGDDGTFAINPRTGNVRGILNGNSPVLMRGPLTSNPEEHNARVLDYFKSCGLPQDQIGQVHAYAALAGSGAANGPVERHLASYTTVIDRVINGTPVPDSFAAARFNVDGDVSMEWVYWPAISASTLDKVNELKANAEQTHSKVPSEMVSENGFVAIHHSDYEDERPFVSFASLDLQVSSDTNSRSRGTTRHFDVNGAEIQSLSIRPATLATRQ